MSQFVTSKMENHDKEEKRGGRRKLPYVFTEQGIAMLSGLLKNEIAIQVSIKIMDAFVEMRKFIASNSNIFNLSTRMEHKFIELGINKFNQQYPILKLVKTNKFHDRFIAIDNKELYHCGESLKDLGKKCFTISKLEDKEMINLIKNVS